MESYRKLGQARLKTGVMIANESHHLCPDGRVSPLGPPPRDILERHLN